MSLTNSATTTIDTTGGNITLSGVIGNSTTGALTKAGPGTLTLSNPEEGGALARIELPRKQP